MILYNLTSELLSGVLGHVTSHKVFLINIFHTKISPD